MKNLLLSLIIVAAVLNSPAASAATTITVSSTADAGSGSLRAALESANDDDTINFSVTGTILLTSGELRVTNSVAITGPGANQLAVDGNHLGRVFYIAPGKTVTISSLTITNGHTGGNGGGIYNDHAMLTVSNCTINGNSAGNAGGGIFNSGLRPGSASLQIVNSTLSGNSATQCGGIYNDGGYGSASLRIVNSTLSGNSASSHGGGIFNFAVDGSVIVEIGNTILNNGAATGPNIDNDSGTVTSLGYNLSSDGTGPNNGTTDQINPNPLLGPLQDNGGPTFTHAPLCGSPAIDKGKNFTTSASDQRGASRTFDDPNVSNAIGGDGSDIGAVETPVAAFLVTNTDNSGAGSLRQAILDANASPGSDIIEFASGVSGTIKLISGELQITDCLFINGPGANQLAVDGNHLGRVFHIGSGKTVTISSLTITNGHTGDNGGGIYNDNAMITVSNCTVSANSASRGGGIHNAGFGVGASLQIVNSTLSGNSAANEGGGIFNAGLDHGSANLTVVNSTLSGNSASSQGGGIYNDGHILGSANLLIANSTLSSNSAAFPASAGGIYNNGLSDGSAIVEVGNTILNTGGATGLNIYNAAGTVTSLGYNLSNDGTGPNNGITDQINPNPLLGPLQDNGGPTFTHALLPDSPAIDAGDPEFVGPPNFDQRGSGFPRVVNDRIDIGAFESPLATPTITTAATAAVQYSDVVTLHAEVSPDTVAGSIQFSVDGTPVSPAVVVSGGVAELNVQVFLAAGSYEIKAEFTSDTGYSYSEGTSTLTVTRENAKVTPRSSNPLAVKVNTAGGTAGPITLCADITEVADGSLGDIVNAVPVTFTLVPVAGGATIRQTNFSGTALNGALSVCVTFTSVPVNVYDITTSIGGNYYTGSAETCLAVYDPSLGFVTGGGNVTHNGAAYFAFTVKYLKNGQPQGSLLYIERRATGDVVLKSNSMGSLAIVGGTAVITGKATLNGVGNHGFRATVVDNGDPGTTDKFGLKVTNPAGAVVLTFDPLTLNGGNIQVPQGKK